MSDDIFRDMTDQMKPSDGLKNQLFSKLDAEDAKQPSADQATVTDIHRGNKAKGFLHSRAIYWVSAAACVLAVTTVSIGLSPNNGWFGQYASSPNHGSKAAPWITAEAADEKGKLEGEAEQAEAYSQIYQKASAIPKWLGVDHYQSFPLGGGGDVLGGGGDVLGGGGDVFPVRAAPVSGMGPVLLTDAAEENSSSDASKYSDDYSQTNVQVKGIDEGDIVKTDGNHIYIASEKDVQIVRASGSTTQEVSKIDTSSAPIKSADISGGGESLFGPVVDMMLYDSILVVLTTEYAPASHYTLPASESQAVVPYNALAIHALLYDVSDPQSPKFLSSFGQSGKHVTSRLLAGVLYLVSDYRVTDTENMSPDKPETFVPVVAQPRGVDPLAPKDIEILPTAQGPRYAVASAIDLANQKLLGKEAILGGSDTVYMSSGNLYLASTDYEGKLTAEEQKATGVTKKSPTTVTHLVRIMLNDGDLKLAAKTSIPGEAINQFAFDEYDNHFRIVVTVRSDETKDHVYQDKAALYVLDQNFEVVGSIPSLVKGESVKSVRFDKAVAYVVTYERVDPLFAIDISDPKSPKVMSALKIPGFSTYLHPWSEGLLLGLGVDGDEDGDTDGMKMSMFDTSDPFDVTEASNIHIPFDEAQALSEHKALFVSKTRNLIGFAAFKWSGNYTRYLIYSYDEENGFKLEKNLKVTPASDNNNEYAWGLPIRGLAIGDNLYVCAGGSVTVYDFDSYKKIATVGIR